VDGGVILRAGFDFQFGMGIDFTDGVYFETQRLDENGNEIPELQIFVEAAIPGLEAQGTLGFLRLDVSDLERTAATINSRNGDNADLIVAARRPGAIFTTADGTEL